MPDNLENYLIDRIDSEKLIYKAWSNKWHAISRLGISTVCSVSMAFSASNYHNGEGLPNEEPRPLHSQDAILPEPQKLEKSKLAPKV